MRIACPACNAAYQVPDDQLAEGRVVRCARCGTDWAPIVAVPASGGEAAPAEVMRAPAVVAVEPEPEPEPVVAARRMAIEEEIPIPRPPVLPKPAPKRRGSALLVLAWVVSLAAVGGGLAGLYAGRDRVMRVWPPSIRAYAAMGLAGHAPTLGEGAPGEGAPVGGAGSEGRE